MKLLSSAALLLCSAMPLAAQIVGRPPEESPFRDLRYRQDVTVFSGYYSAGRDPAGVAPQGGPYFGGRYSIRIAGPVSFMGRLAFALSERTIVDPQQNDGQRILGVEGWPIAFADANLAMNLTGQKSWRNLVPTATGGIGLVTDFESEADTGNFTFGTKFALNIGAGVRWVATDRIEVRLDWTDYLYKIDYPNLYYIRTSDNTQFLPGTQAQSLWTHNHAFSLGVAYRFWR